MRMLFVLFAAVAASGCGLLGSLTRTSNDLPRPVKLLEYTNVNDTHRITLHSNEPGKDQY